MDVTILPAVNASLNAASAMLLLRGYWMIRRRRSDSHKHAMVAACLTSLLFLASYLYYHAHHGSTPFPGKGTIRAVYFTILLSHTVLATAIVPLVILTLVNAFRGTLEKHKRLARVLFPAWMYVSVTGVLIYWMLYRVTYTNP